MAYKVLYRKYRPQDFDTLYGQDNIKKLLIESINLNKLSHAYIFSGPRGTGKTSTAKLFAKAINCESPVDGNPCGKCNACENYLTSSDIIEIDAASNNGVDEIRELRDNVKIMPSFSKYKVYIIDEVHMLSSSAWNAFLKTLEEPPKHVIFILATTEIQKVPITVLSRCQRYIFNRISNDIIVNNLRRVSDEEGIDISNDALEYIADLSDGGMRDALSYLDQISKNENKIEISDVEQSFGIIGQSFIDNLFDNIENNKETEVINLLDELINNNVDLNNIIVKIIDTLIKKIIKNKNNNELVKQLAFDLESCVFKKNAKSLFKLTVLNYFYSLNINFNEKNISREIKSINEIREITVNSNFEKIEDYKKSDINYDNNNNNNSYLISDEIIRIRVNNSFVNCSKIYKSTFESKWDDLLKKIKFNNKELYSLMEDIVVEVVSDKNALLSIKNKSQSILFNKSVNVIEKMYLDNFGDNYKLVCVPENLVKQEKQKYLDTLSNNLLYNYIEETSLEDKSEIIVSAKDIFDDNLIEIKEEK